MVKRNLVKRIAAFALAAVVTMTSSLTGVGTMTVNAADSYSFQAENLLVNPDFESDTAFDAAGGSHVGNWHYWQSASKETEVTHTGNGAAKFTAGQSSLEQDVAASDLVKGMTYVYSVWAKLSNEVAATSTNYSIGVKNYGGTELKQYVTSTEWTKYEIEFVYTGGDARVYGWVAALENSAVMYIDDASLVAKSSVSSAKIQNGQISVTFANDLASAPLVDDFAATYYVGTDSANAEVLKLTTEKWDAETNTVTLAFDEIAKLAGTEQLVNVTLSYKGETAINLDFTVEAGEGEAVVAAISSVNAENGKVTVVLDKEPTVEPTVSQFTWEAKTDDGEYNTLSVSDFAYDRETKTVTVNSDVFRSTEDCTVTVKVTYNGSSKEASFDVTATAGTVYYVDSTNGDDANDGTSEETAFASIDKLNTLTFLPGDQILFKRGETFTGCFKPQGSGMEGAPIKIGAYGDGDVKPVLQPGKEWTVPYVMSANAMDTNVKVNYVIQFYNVEYWEVSDLEIKDPDSEEYLTKGSDKYIVSYPVYRSGITVQAEDVGTLQHIYIDNVIIHGFHGPGTNIGKTSGGITMNVITNQSRNIAQSVPTQINDIRVTNCEIYDVGRSGINFLTPWSFRTDEKWGPFNYGNRNYNYLPYEDFYMANNYIHDIDGDGTIIDNCSGAVAEYNLVTRCCLRPQTEGGGAAVGLFNWNSDNTTFQFNEVYDIRLGSGSTASNDGQGIEIDALNDVTYVQYNYVHDNMGGFMMYCNVGDYYRSFDGIVRYNISQNDYAHPRQGLFDIYAANYGTEIYNNTFYFTDRTLNSAGKVFLFYSASAYETMKFYNNIFYYDGTKETVEVNTFGDNAIDWQSNIFYRFANLPVDDNPSAPNLNVDPMLKAPGEGATGEDGIVMNRAQAGVIDWVDVTAYELLEGSPAINAGVPLENNGGRDYFGNKVTGIPDIGAYESGSVLLKLVSTNADIVADQEEMTFSVADTAKVTAKTLLNSLVYEEGVEVTVTRGSIVLEGGIRLADGDVVTGTYNGETIAYTVKLVEGGSESGDEIPAEHMLAFAGTEETSSEDGKAANVLDGNTGTIWHSNYSGTAPAAEDKYLTLEIKDGYDYEVTGYVYTPRSGAGNGTITTYAIYVSDDNEDWTEVATGTWELTATAKTVIFDEPVNAKYVKLLAVESKGGWASAAEARLLGNGGLIDTDVPTTPEVTASDVAANEVTVNWTESTDANGITDYVLLVNGEEFATFDPDVTSYTVKGLEAGKTYTFSVYAVDVTGKKSEMSTVTVKTTEDGEVKEEVERLYGSGRYETAYAVADAYKETLGVAKFDTVIVATGTNFADALSGSYLASVKNAPILLTNGKADNIAMLCEYLVKNVTAGGKVYILGGTGAVSQDVENMIKEVGYTVSRISGSSRYETSLKILKEAGIAGSEIIVATGKKFADSLSASATGRPIMLVKPGEALSADQKAVLTGMNGATIFIVGGTGAVSEAIEEELSAYGEIVRLSGATRYETSVKVAETFFDDVTTAVVASGKNFPDGLCGGPLAAAFNAPLILTKDGDTTAAAGYVAGNGITSGYVLGGSGALSDATVIEVFGLE